MRAGCQCVVALGFAMLCLACGCSTSAVLSRGRLMDVEGKIEASDDEYIYVRTDTGIKPVPKSEVTDVDHPGDGAIVVGAALATYGVINIGVGMKECEHRTGAEKTGFCLGMVTPLTLGVILAAWGMAVHSGSVDGMSRRPPRGARPQIGLEPGLSGLGVVASW